MADSREEAVYLSVITSREFEACAAHELEAYACARAASFAACARAVSFFLCCLRCSLRCASSYLIRIRVEVAISTQG